MSDGAPITPEWRWPSGPPTTDGELVGTGFGFTEGPVWLDPADAARNGLGERAGLLVSDLDGDAQWFGAADGLHLVRRPSGVANGSALDADGRIVSCEHRGRRLARLVDGEWTTIVDSVDGARLNSPNDVCRRADGTLLFTDPPYGIEPHERELDVDGLYALPPAADGGRPAPVLLDASMARPNGVAVDRDGRSIWVADTEAGTVTRHAPIGDDPDRATRFEVVERHHGFERPDGLCVDADGQLLVAVVGGVAVLDDGSATLAIAIDERPANLCLGGGDDELWVCARTTVRRFAWHGRRAPGAAS